MGRVRQGRDAEFQKWKLRFVKGQDTWWKFRMSLGRGDAWIGVPVWCYTECNTDRTWLQLMCCAPSRPRCPDFRGQEVKIQGFKGAVGAKVNLELTEQ